MKSIIKLSIIVLLITLSSKSFSQILGVKAGTNFSSQLIKENEILFPYDNSSNDKTKLNPGFLVGASIEMPVFDLLSFEASLLFSTRGTRITKTELFDSNSVITEENHNLYYLELPLAAKVPFSIGSFKLYGSAGGYAGIGLTGKIKSNSSFGYLTETSNENIIWGSETSVDDLKRLDYGLTFGVGIIWKSLQAGLSYNLGLANISAESDYGSLIKNRSLGVSVSYIFGGPKENVPVTVKEPKGREEKNKDATSGGEKPVGNNIKSEKSLKIKSGGKKAAEFEAERIMLEKVRTDSLAAVAAQQEKIRIEKVRADSIEAAKAMAAKAEEERLLQEKAKADSLAAAQKAAQNTVVYRVQFASNATAKGSYSVTITGKSYKTWEYSYSGAYRSTVGEFKTLAEATAFQKLVRQSGYPQAFVVAFKNNVRTTDPTLFK
jgi:hypothetical protein